MDDDVKVTELLRKVLEADGHEVVVAFDGRTVVDEVATRCADLVILDIDMPYLNGFEICRQIKSDPRTRIIPILILTGVAAGDRIRAWELGADEFLTKPFKPQEVAARARSLLRHKDLVDALDSAESVVFSLVRALEGKSPYTHGHSGRVMQYALALAKSFGLSEADMDILRRGVLLHDIGKISTPDVILNKPGQLTPEEIEVIRLHPIEGARIVGPLRSARDAIPLIRWHHERMDGKGYPDGLMGRTIPLSVRVLSVADMYDALSSDRPYRSAMTHNQCQEVMVENAKSGGLDPELVRAFFKCFSGAIGAASVAEPKGMASEFPR